MGLRSSSVITEYSTAFVNSVDPVQTVLATIATDNINASSIQIFFICDCILLALDPVQLKVLGQSANQSHKILSCSVHSSDNVITVVTDDGSMYMMNTASNNVRSVETDRYVPPSSIGAICWLNKSDLVSVGLEGTIALWRSYEENHPLLYVTSINMWRKSAQCVTRLEGSHFAVGYKDGTLSVSYAELQGGTERLAHTHSYAGHISAITVITSYTFAKTDGQSVVIGTGSTDQSIRLWCMRDIDLYCSSSSPVPHMIYMLSSAISGLAFRRDGKFLAGCSLSGELVVVHTVMADLALQSQLVLRLNLRLKKTTATSLVWAPAGDKLFVSLDDSRIVTIQLRTLSVS